MAHKLWPASCGPYYMSHIISYNLYGPIYNPYLMAHNIWPKLYGPYYDGNIVKVFGSYGQVEHKQKYKCIKW